MTQRTITKAIQEGFSYLDFKQNGDGGFTSYLSTDQHMLSTEQPVRTVFVPSIILSALTYAPEFDGTTLKKRLMEYLLTQKSPEWSFNYWAKNEPLRLTRNYPDDLDDTFCTLIALYYADRTLISPEVLASVVKLLLATEKSVGGPYRTWIVSENNPEIWLDVDPAVNSNIARFLSLVSEPPLGLTSFLKQSLEEHSLLSPYYPSELSTLYYLAHTYTGDSKLFLEKIYSSLDALDTAVLYKAMATSTLLRLDPHADVRHWIKDILHAQRIDGSWQASGYCIDRHIQGNTYYNGSDTLTTALAIEALSVYQKSTRQSKTKKYSKDIKEEQAFHNALAHINHLTPPPKQTLIAFLQKLISSSNGQEILQLAAKCNSALIKPLPGDDQSFSNTLAVANLYGWTAYTIYDDFIDEEGDPYLLPAANIAHRISYETFLRALPRHSSFKQYVRETFDLIDTANMWEIQNCRFDTGDNTIAIGVLPEYKNLEYLAYRSLGHTIGPLAVLAKSGYAVNSNSFQYMRTALMHYIIAKQLNDDAHDWQSDFNNGHISYVVVKILQELSVPSGAYKKSELFRVMRGHFWRHTLITICDIMHYHIMLARKALKKAACMQPHNIITTLLDTIELSIQNTRTTQKETLEFIKYFG